MQKLLFEVPLSPLEGERPGERGQVEFSRQLQQGKAMSDFVLPLSQNPAPPLSQPLSREGREEPKRSSFNQLIFFALQSTSTHRYENTNYFLRTTSNVLTILQRDSSRRIDHRRHHPHTPNLDCRQHHHRSRHCHQPHARPLPTLPSRLFRRPNVPRQFSARPRWRRQPLHRSTTTATHRR